MELCTLSFEALLGLDVQMQVVVGTCTDCVRARYHSSPIERPGEKWNDHSESTVQSIGDREYE